MANFFKELLGISKKSKTSTAGAIAGGLFDVAVRAIPGPVGDVARDVVGGIRSTAAAKEAKKQQRTSVAQAARVFNPGIARDPKETKKNIRQAVGSVVGAVAGRPTTSSRRVSIRSRGTTASTSRPGAGRTGITSSRPAGATPNLSPTPTSSRVRAATPNELAELQRKGIKGIRGPSFFAKGAITPQAKPLPSAGRVVSTAPRATLRPGLLPGGGTSLSGMAMPRLKKTAPIPTRSILTATGAGAAAQRLIPGAPRKIAGRPTVLGGILGGLGQIPELLKGPGIIAQPTVAAGTKVVRPPRVTVKPPTKEAVISPVPTLGRQIGRIAVDVALDALTQKLQKGKTMPTARAVARNGVRVPGGMGPVSEEALRKARFAIDPRSGCLQDIDVLRQELPEDEIPKGRYKINVKTGRFIKIKRRRMNPLNFRALLRANRRNEGFQRIVMRNFTTATPGTRLKPKRGRVVRRKRRRA